MAEGFSKVFARFVNSTVKIGDMKELKVWTAANGTMYFKTKYLYVNANVSQFEWRSTGWMCCAILYVTIHKPVIEDEERI